jgi:Tol biopolymer transport system component
MKNSFRKIKIISLLMPLILIIACKVDDFQPTEYTQYKTIRKYNIITDQITDLTSGYNAYYPVPSPDGSKIGFIRKDADNTGTLCIINSDGTNLNEIVKIVNFDTERNKLVWSPCGTKILFNDGYKLNKIDLQTKEITHLATISKYHYYSFSFSPDGNRIVYYWRDGLSSGSANVLNTLLILPTVNTYFYFHHNSWTQDSNSILIDNQGANGRRISIISYDGLTITDLFYKEGYYAMYPSYSYNYSKILFLKGFYDFSGYISLCVIDSDGTNFIQITNDTSKVSFATWSPDNSKIFFILNSQGYIVNSDGTNIKKLNLNINNSDINWLNSENIIY